MGVVVEGRVSEQAERSEAKVKRASSERITADRREALYQAGVEGKQASYMLEGRRSRGAY